MTTSRIACLWILFGLIVCSTGCTSQAWYTGLQTGAQNNCDKQPPGAREACQSRLNKKSYDAYEQERSAPR